MTFTEKDIQAIKAVFSEMGKWNCDNLMSLVGSMNVEPVYNLANKIHYEDYCKRHGITYEEMTQEDYENAYLEKYEA